MLGRKPIKNMAAHMGFHAAIGIPITLLVRRALSENPGTPMQNWGGIAYEVRDYSLAFPAIFMLAAESFDSVRETGDASSNTVAQ